MTDTPFMDINAILKYLPHRYPFLLVDRVLVCNRGENIRALKNVTVGFAARPIQYASKATSDAFPEIRAATVAVSGIGPTVKKADSTRPAANSVFHGTPV